MIGLNIQSLNIQSDQTVDPGEEDSPVVPYRDSNPRPFDHESRALTTELQTVRQVMLQTIRCQSARH